MGRVGSQRRTYQVVRPWSIRPDAFADFSRFKLLLLARFTLVKLCVLVQIEFRGKLLAAILEVANKLFKAGVSR